MFTQIDQRKKDSYLNIINSKLKQNSEKLDYTFKTFQSINKISSQILNSVVTSITDEVRFLREKKSALLGSELITTADQARLDQTETRPFKPRLSQTDFSTKLENLLNSLFADPSERINETLVNSLYFRIPQYSDEAKKIAKSRFGITNNEWDKKNVFDELNNSLSVFKEERKVYVYYETTRQYFNVESKIECFDLSERNSTLALGCQNGQAYIIDRSRGIESSNSGPLRLEYVNLNNSSASLTKMKYSASGQILCFSNFNNQVYVYKDNSYLSDYKVEQNSLKISIVSFIHATDTFCFIGTKEGGVYIYSIESDTWSGIRPFTNTIDNILVSLNNKILLIVSDKEIKAFKLEHENIRVAQVPIWEKSVKSILFLTLVEENYEYFVLLDKKIGLVFNIQTGVLVQEVKSLFRYIVLCSQYKNLIKYCHLME